ncbi:ABC transporter substrate-binding protein [Devosia sp. 2618]|uniref:ABC transporter substrate-binding protein n=1 Tax=Devosia sp. 2618 TaxID=3156454 RepID=UPI0033984836
MTKSLNRRQFGLGATALLAGASLPVTAFAQSATRTVTTLLGTYDIPKNPKRVVAIDPRTDYEPALVLGLPIIAVGQSEFWGDLSNTPRSPELISIPLPTTAEAVLALEPDLIICSGEDPSGDWWPAARLQQIAPVLTTTFTRKWQDDLLELADWLDRREPADKAVADYTAAADAIKVRYADQLAKDKVAILTFSAEFRSFNVFIPGGEYSDPKGQLLADVGAITIDPKILGDGESFGMESIVDVLGDVDAILLCNMGNGSVSDLEGDVLWQRLPAVVAGRVHESTGYMWYGSYFTAMKALGELEATLALGA